MDREQQREIGVIRLGAANAVARGDSTLVGTIHANEILMEHLALAGVELFRDYTAEQRRRMAMEGRAMADGSFPIATCFDAATASLALGRVKPENRAAVDAFIVRRIHALGCLEPAT